MSALNLEGSFTAVTLGRARTIARHGEVIIDEQPSEGSKYLCGRVQGTARKPYEVEVLVDGEKIRSYCSCPVITRCKHGAALLMVWMASTLTTSDVADNDRSTSRRQQLANAIDYDEDVLQWVDTLVSSLASTTLHTESKTQDSPRDIKIIYELCALRNRLGVTLGVRALKAAQHNSGVYISGRAYPQEDYYGFYEADASDCDEIIMDLLRMSMERNGFVSEGRKNKGTIVLQGSLGAYVLAQMLESGRLFWQDEREFACTLGPEKTADVRWNKLKGKGKKAVLQIGTDLHDNGQLHLANTSPVWYVDPLRHQAGIVTSEYSASILNAVTQAPQLPAKAAQAFSNLLASQSENPPLPLPVETSLVFARDPLVCRLRIYSLDGSAQVNQWCAQVLMCYGEHQFNVELKPRSRVSSLTLEDGTEVEVTRDHDKEYRQYQFFRRRVSGFEPMYARDPEIFSIADHQPLSRSDDDRFRAFERLFDAFDTLRSEGFEIEVEAPVSLEAETVTDFDFNIQPTDSGWFDLGLQLKHDGSRYDLLPLVLHWLERGDRNQPLTVMATDGRRLTVPPEMVRPVAETLLELYDDSYEQVSLSRARALSLTRLNDEMEEAGASSEWNGDKTLFALAAKMDLIKADQQALLKSAKAPRTLKAELRAYQLSGMAWLNFLHDAGLCGVLADDMGLGKTIQTLAHILSLKQRRKLTGPCLVVAPTSVLHNWARETQRFAPSLKVRIWHGADRRDTPLNEGRAMLVVTSYALALRDHDMLAAHGFALLVLDEAQIIKNPAAKITQSLKRMPIEQRLCLTGTPLENHLGELWSLYDFLMPGLLGPQKRFTQHFRTPIEKHGDSERQKRLNNAIGPFLLRRRKQAVAAELPAKTEIIRKIELDSEQAKLYETIRIGMEKRVRALLQEKGVARSHIQMLDALLKLRQSCCHPELVKLDSARRVKSSAKTEYVLGMIDELVAEGRKILLFSQFTQMLDILEREIKKRNIAYVKLTGKTRKRQLAIDTFQSGDAPLFLISLKAGGTGLNLTAADTVIHYDPWWNPAVENQATDRAHRIGQDKPVFVYKLIAGNTVEDKIVAMQARKQALSDATVEDGSANPVKSMSADDILSLFADG